ncbi:transposase [Streptomyces sp. NPDC019396]|uniref:transposase n=1 Tax=Streptomyces sp. NPDC019396 TaxID=3154687 RepID=UPI0033DDE17C
MKALFEIVAGPLAQPRTPGVRYRRWRTVAFDGCSSITVPDAERNRGRFGRPRNRYGWTGYPLLRLMALVETGSRGLLGAVFGPRSYGENHYAQRLLHLLGPDMLVLADRGFDDGKFLAKVAGTGAQFLVRLTSNRRPPTVGRLPDGSHLARIRGVTVRIIEADITATCADGSRLHDGYRLATTLLDPGLDPAEALVRLYHERWEIESAYYALRHTLMNGRVLRSGDPFGIEQEMWALLSLCQLLRTAMVDAVESAPGTDPDRASFTVALEAARDQLVAAHADGNGHDLVGRIGRAVLSNLLPARRARISVRKVKCQTSRYAYANPEDPRPRSSTRIDSLAISIHAVQQTTAPFVSSRHPVPTVKPEPVPRPPSLIERALDVLRSHPGRRWGAQELAAEVGVDNVNSFCVLVARWARNGLISKLHHGVYALLDESATPPPSPPTLPTPPLPAVDPTLSRFQAALLILRSAPQYAWTATEIAPALGITNLNSFRV